MDYINETLKTPVFGEYDVVVAGAGPAGVCAAIAAARNGAKTLLIERYGFLGGMWSAGFIIPLFDFENKHYIVTEIVDELKARGGWGGYYDIAFDFEIMKKLLDDMVTQSGAQILFHTFLAGAYCEGEDVKGVFIQNKSGRSLVKAKVVIDCTGDGDIAASAGVPFTMGRESDNLCQPVTCMFMLGNIEYMQPHYYSIRDAVIEASKACGIPFEFSYKRPFVLQLPNCKRCVVMWNHVRKKPPTDAVAFSEAELESREEIHRIFDYIKKNVPMFKDVELIAIAPQTGVRESRHIHGLYTLETDECVHGAQFEDGICDVAFSMDLHLPDKDEQENIHLEAPYQIPYRCLVPVNRNGLLVAGRCISGTYETNGSYRVTGDCMATGQAAGAAAALAVKQNVNVRDVDIHQLRKIVGME
ncbi:MAG TPA: FAD-dependent oxidoreductase [Firmicutes bacterium]|nr:FAD-dependent oxidoreductase [Bacillota bacterium]